MKSHERLALTATPTERGDRKGMFLVVDGSRHTVRGNRLSSNPALQLLTVRRD